MPWLIVEVISNSVRTPSCQDRSIVRPPRACAVRGPAAATFSGTGARKEARPRVAAAVSCSLTCNEIRQARDQPSGVRRGRGAGPTVPADDPGGRRTLKDLRRAVGLPAAIALPRSRVRRDRLPTRPQTSISSSVSGAGRPRNGRTGPCGSLVRRSLRHRTAGLRGRVGLPLATAHRMPGCRGRCSAIRTSRCRR